MQEYISQVMFLCIYVCLYEPLFVKSLANLPYLGCDFVAPIHKYTNTTQKTVFLLSKGFYFCNRFLCIFCFAKKVISLDRYTDTHAKWPLFYLCLRFFYLERGGNFLLSPATTKLLKNNCFSYLLYSLCRFLYPKLNGFAKTFQPTEKDSTCWNPKVISDFSN